MHEFNRNYGLHTLKSERFVVENPLFVGQQHGCGIDLGQRFNHRLAEF